ncbi:MAG: FAD binding domain-containing protein, partial [Candidatus Hodarchaeales archaeon]
MVVNVKEFHKPDNIDDAIALLCREKPLTRIISGGTCIVPNKNPSIEALVDINGLNLSYIKLKDNNLFIGATTTITQMLNDDTVNSWCGGLLTQACKVIADTLLKNVITIGGNIARPYSWCDLPVVLLGLDAVIHVAKQGNESVSIKAVDFFAQQPVNLLGKADIITEIEFPAMKGKGAFHKFARTKVDYALFDCMVYAEIEDGTVKDIRLALSGC